MSATDGTDGSPPNPVGPDGAESLSDHQYFQRVEEVFIALRGAPLLLSPKDWQTAREWHRQGIPLDLVTRTLEEVFERRREREDDKTVSTLRYCNRAVLAAWKELRELTAVGRDGTAGTGEVVAPFDPRGRLQALSAALPDDLPGRGGVAERLLALAGPEEAPADARAVEEALAALDREVIAELVDRLDADRRRALEAEAEATVRSLADRVPQQEVARARRRVLEQKVRRLYALPTLSLFAPEAEG